jgi:5-bromo-4-chloroindolyl phosphate hydrolysis protein
MSQVKRYTPKKITGSAKALLLYLLPTPIVFTFIFSFFATDGGSVIKSLISLTLFFAAARFAKKGLINEKEYNSSPIAKAPKPPFKLLSAVTLSVATLYTSATLTDNNALFSIVLAISSFAGFYLYYGLDPREDKLPNLPLGVDAKDVIEITEDALKRIEELKEYRYELKNPLTKDLLTHIISESEEIVREVQTSPIDLQKVRKFFKIYLDRTQKISKEYLKNLKNGNIDSKMEKNYNTLLKSVKETIDEQKERLSDDDILRLDIQIEALTKQIKHEGV